MLTIKDVPMTMASVQVQLTESKRWIHVRVGALDPATTTSGRGQRLAHLGYLPPNLSTGHALIIGEMLEAFAADAAPDAKTEADADKALKDKHGV
jgi:hypothetical protein